MLFRSGHGGRRWGGTLVETAVVGATAFLLLIGLIVTGLGVYRYQQMAALAREGARWAAVHGPSWQTNQGGTRPTSATLLSTVIVPKAAGLDTTKLTCDLEWPSPVGTAPTGMVSVTLSYTWTPEAFLSPVTLTSKSVVPILY
jgi:hypothetical protein